jgi:hypothetical protein
MPKKNEANLFLSCLEATQADKEERDRGYLEKVAVELVRGVLTPGRVAQIFRDQSDEFPMLTVELESGVPVSSVRASRAWRMDNLAAFLKKPGGKAWAALRKARSEHGREAMVVFPVTGLGDVLLGYAGAFGRTNPPWQIVVDTPNNTAVMAPLKEGN